VPILDHVVAFIKLLGAGDCGNFVIIEFSKLTCYGPVGNQEGGTIGPIHTEEIDIGAIVELIVGQIHNPDILVVDTFEGDEVLLAGDMEDYFTGAEPGESFDIGPDGPAIEAEGLHELFYLIKTRITVRVIHQLSELLVGNGYAQLRGNVLRGRGCAVLRLEAFGGQKGQSLT
jgi:hypothetical protein